MKETRQEKQKEKMNIMSKIFRRRSIYLAICSGYHAPVTMHQRIALLLHINRINNQRDGNMTDLKIRSHFPGLGAQ